MLIDAGCLLGRFSPKLLDAETLGVSGSDLLGLASLSRACSEVGAPMFWDGGRVNVILEMGVPILKGKVLNLTLRAPTFRDRPLIPRAKAYI